VVVAVAVPLGVVLVIPVSIIAVPVGKSTIVAITVADAVVVAIAVAIANTAIVAIMIAVAMNLVSFSIFVMAEIADGLPESFVMGQMILAHFVKHLPPAIARCLHRGDLVEGQRLGPVLRRELRAIQSARNGLVARR
jgi:hypothetical protein